ncbi:unnamed protein product [Ostreobium quekettii]|uniref:Uncharacterized protein n=1 Tax=Ostreobium quekettii TaxID=121088 RepID=A0A8S1JDE1_9CHLO|nr:unnamed protein product [Ostreobium quekettii]|eukprot:evm.model.scf_1143.2 EVM.evm.TU.scf_1143.2   scf_1143:6321-8350(+)
MLRISQACGLDTLGVGGAQGPDGAWYLSLAFGCSSSESACKCGIVADDGTAALEDPAPELPGPGDVITQSSVPLMSSVGEAAFFKGDGEDRCRQNVTAECSNRNQPIFVAAQSAIDKDEACPTDNLLGSGLSMSEIANQIAACINAYRELPDAFSDDLFCEYDFRLEVVQPPRTGLAFSVQETQGPAQPLDM